MNDVIFMLIGLILNPFINIVWNIIFMSYIPNTLYVLWEKRKGDRSIMTQAEANKYYEGDAFNLTSNLATLMNTVLSCLWFSSITPLAIPFAVAAIWLNYFVTKIMVVYYHKKPESYGKELIQFFTGLLPSMVVVWSIGMLFFF